MRHEGYGKHHRGEGHGRKRRGGEGRQHGAKTFRRGRAVSFLQQMELQRETLKKQLETLELQTINPVLVGELKATESIIAEFKHLFELYEQEISATEEEAQQ